MVIARKLKPWLGVGALLWAPVLIADCSLVWDIQPATLDTQATTDGGAKPDGAAGSEGGPDSSKPDVKPAPGCKATGEPCADCIASTCCDPFNTCVQDTACNQALVAYDRCVASAPDGGGSSCAEAFGQTSPGADGLVQCVFFSKCDAQCRFKQLQSPCDKYCGCMEISCPTATFSNGTCMDSCPLLNTEQLDCRTYHCQFAASDPETHCPHALGLAVCK